MPDDELPPPRISPRQRSIFEDSGPAPVEAADAAYFDAGIRWAEPPFIVYVENPRPKHRKPKTRPPGTASMA